MPDRDISRQVEERLNELYERHLPVEDGSVFQYYDPGREYYGPELAGDERDSFAISVAALDGETTCVGSSEESFAIQSISKVFAYALALEDHGRDYVLRHVGVEPTGDAFNSIVFDERHKRPHNPMVNSGALATTALVRGRDSAEKLDRVLEIVRGCAGNDELDVDWETFEREIATADRNRAVAYLMRSQGMLDGDVEATLALYLQSCSIKVTCRDLAVMAATLANGAVNPVTGRRVLSRARTRDVLSVMYTCGMYDFAGEWAFEVGVPAKSGVSGAILAPIPGKMGIGVFSPGLDRYGNSVRGVKVCEEVACRLGLHVFATPGEDALLGPAPPAGSIKTGG
jgi:glutaminase